MTEQDLVDFELHSEIQYAGTPIARRVWGAFILSQGLPEYVDHLNLGEKDPVRYWRRDYRVLSSVRLTQSLVSKSISLERMGKQTHRLLTDYYIDRSEEGYEPLSTSE